MVNIWLIVITPISYALNDFKFVGFGLLVNWGISFPLIPLNPDFMLKLWNCRRNIIIYECVYMVTLSRWTIPRCAQCLQVSSARLWWPGPCDREVCLPPQCIRLPAGRQASERRLCERSAFLLEVGQDRRHDLPHSRVRRLRPRQRKLPHPPEVHEYLSLSLLGCQIVRNHFLNQYVCIVFQYTNLTWRVNSSTD